MNVRFWLKFPLKILVNVPFPSIILIIANVLLYWSITVTVPFNGFSNSSVSVIGMFIRVFGVVFTESTSVSYTHLTLPTILRV